MAKWFGGSTQLRESMDELSSLIYAIT